MFLPITLEGWKTKREPFRGEMTDYREEKKLSPYQAFVFWVSETPESLGTQHLCYNVSITRLTCEEKYKWGYLNEASHLMKN